MYYTFIITLVVNNIFLIYFYLKYKKLFQEENELCQKKFELKIQEWNTYKKENQCELFYIDYIKKTKTPIYYWKTKDGKTIINHFD